MVESQGESDRVAGGTQSIQGSAGHARSLQLILSDEKNLKG